MKGRGILRGEEVSEFTEKALILLNCLLPTNWLLNNQLDIWTSTDLSCSCSVLNASIVEGNKLLHVWVKLFHQQLIKKSNYMHLRVQWIYGYHSCIYVSHIVSSNFRLFHFIKTVHTFKVCYFTLFNSVHRYIFSRNFMCKCHRKKRKFQEKRMEVGVVDIYYIAPLKSIWLIKALL